MSSHVPNKTPSKSYSSDKEDTGVMEVTEGVNMMKVTEGVGMMELTENVGMMEMSEGPGITGDSGIGEADTPGNPDTNTITRLDGDSAVHEALAKSTVKDTEHIPAGEVLNPKEAGVTKESTPVAELPEVIEGENLAIYGAIPCFLCQDTEPFTEEDAAVLSQFIPDFWVQSGVLNTATLKTLHTSISKQSEKLQKKIGILSLEPFLTHIDICIQIAMEDKMDPSKQYILSEDASDRMVHEFTIGWVNTLNFVSNRASDSCNMHALKFLRDLHGVFGNGDLGPVQTFITRLYCMIFGLLSASYEETFPKLVGLGSILAT